MEPYQEKAWDCLTKPEQDSLFLNISQGLSTRKVGDILHMSHYKYMELKARAEKLFKLFSDYFYKHSDLVSPKAPIGNDFRDYLYGTMTKRLSKEEALVYVGDSVWRVQEYQTSKTEKNMKRLKESKNIWDQDLYKLIMEFDRWNSYRILPRMLQAPSPYKRRTNKKYKIYLSFLHQIPTYKLDYIIDNYWKKSGPVNYIALVSEDRFKYGYQVVPVSQDAEVTAALTGMKVYVFQDFTDAEDFGLQASNFFLIGVTTTGMKFWGHFHELIQRAVNFREINNMDFVIGELDNAYALKRKMTWADSMNQKKKEKKKKREKEAQLEAQLEASSTLQ